MRRERLLPVKRIREIWAGKAAFKPNPECKQKMENVNEI